MIRCDAIALCAGLWSREVGAMSGGRSARASLRAFLSSDQARSRVSSVTCPTLSDHDNHLYIRDDSGGLLVGCFEPMGKPIKRREFLTRSFEFGLLPEDWDHFEPMMMNALTSSARA